MKTSIALCFIFILVTQVSAKKACEIQIIEQCLKNELAKATLAGSFTTFTAFFSAKLALWMAGFSSLGPVAGSLAAWLQSVYGIGPIFSFLQSLAMGKASILLGPAVTVGALTGFVYYFTSCLKFECIFSDDGKQIKNENQQSYWGKIKEITSKYIRILKAKTQYILEVIELALNLLWEEFKKQKQQYQQQQQKQQYRRIIKFLEEQKKCYFRNSTQNNIYEFFTFVS